MTDPTNLRRSDDPRRDGPSDGLAERLQQDEDLRATWRALGELRETSEGLSTSARERILERVRAEEPRLGWSAAPRWVRVGAGAALLVGVGLGLLVGSAIAPLSSLEPGPETIAAASDGVGSELRDDRFDGEDAWGADPWAGDSWAGDSWAGDSWAGDSWAGALWLVAEADDAELDRLLAPPAAAAGAEGPAT